MRTLQQEVIDNMLDGFDSVDADWLRVMNRESGIYEGWKSEAIREHLSDIIGEDE